MPMVKSKYRFVLFDFRLSLLLFLVEEGRKGKVGKEGHRKSETVKAH